MYVLINGAFGVGKSTVARELRRRLNGGIYNPEIAGLILMRMPGYRVSDFQDLRAWRRCTVGGAKALGMFRSIVIVPMALSNLTYLDEIRSGLANPVRPVLHFCLTAPLAVVRERLAARGAPARASEMAWVQRRAEECCAAHTNAAFAVSIPTKGRTPGEIADDIVVRLARS